ncbi:MAG: T9SS type A sorting domain-containing protein [Flavobacteriales bacterium]|jgi:photosystem II stability/assembly factor-like uncharacterized protein/PKD repeat protein
MRFLFILLLAATLGRAQSHYTPFYSASQEGKPLWVQLMYAAQPNFQEVVAAYQAYYSTHAFVKNEDTHYFKHWVARVRPYVQADGSIVMPTADQRSSQEEQIRNLQGNDQRGNSLNLWHYEGPIHHVNGEGSPMEPGFRHSNVYCHDRSTSNPLVLYCGTESGGLYKTVDGGEHWQYVTSQLIMGSVTAVRIKPSDDQTVIISAENDLYRTTDGGQTWQIIGQSWFISENISAWEIAYAPDNDNVVFAATSQGLFRSEDGGDNFTEILPNRCEAIAFKPGDPQTVYCIHFDFGVDHAQFYKSTDGGQTFVQSVSGWFDSSMGDIDIQGGRLAVTEADPNRIYACLVGYQNAGSTVTTNGWVGTWVSYDAGETWSLPHGLIGAPYTADHPNLMNFQGDDGDYSQIHYNTTMVASQLDPDKILIGGLNLWQSNDAGATYEGVGGYIGGIAQFHVDQQEYRIYKTSETTEEIWFSNDGGIGHSSDFMQSHDNLNRGLFAVNLWGYDQGWNEDMMVGGRYHNGNMAYHENYPSGEFLALGGGEAATGYVKYTDENKVMFSDIGGRILPETLDGQSQYFGLGMSPNESYWNNGSSRVMFDHEYFNVAWLGKENKLYRSTNGGGSFSEFYAFGTSVNNGIYWMEQSYADPNHLYVQQGVGNTGKLWHSSDHGITWEEMDLPQNLRYFSFSLSGTNPLELWISFYDGNNSNKVFRTQDGGTNWENLTTSTLNGLYPWAIAHQYGTDGGVYLAMQHGVVFYRNNSMSDWMSYSTGLPVGTEPLRIVPFVRDNVVRLATWNLGVWEAPAYEPSALIANFSAAFETFFCPGDEVHFVNHSVCSANATFEWSFPGATPATSTEPYPTVVYNTPGTYDVTLTVTDGGESQTVTYTNYISSAEGTGGDFYEDFETAGFPDSWVVEEGAAWTVTGDASGFGTGNYCMRYDNYYNDAQGARHRVWLGKRSGSDLGISFDVAYAQYSDGYTDTLAVVYSTDCGDTWTELWSLGGDDLSTAPDNTGYYVPVASEWASYGANLPGGVLFEDVIIAFENRGHYGNVIYVDNINVFTNFSVDETSGSSAAMTVFPNPASTQLRISASDLHGGNYRIQLFDLTGKLVIETTVFAAGARLEKSIDLPELANGQYVVTLAGDKETIRQSLTIVR